MLLVFVRSIGRNVIKYLASTKLAAEWSDYLSPLEVHLFIP